MAVHRSTGLSGRGPPPDPNDPTPSAVHQVADHLGQLLENLGEGFGTLDADWRITFVNRKTEQLLGLPRSALLGRNVWERLPGLAGSPFDVALRQAMLGHESVEVSDHFEPTRRWYELRIQPSNGGLALYLRDVTEPRRLAARLEVEQQRLLMAQAVAKVGSWDTDLRTGRLDWSAQTYRICETDPRTFGHTHADFLALVHPDDRAAVDAAFEASLGQQGTQVIEHRLRLRAGVEKYVEERWQIYRDAQGRAVRALGTCQDVSERKRADEALRQSQALVGIAGTVAQVGGWSIDVAAMTLQWSDLAASIHGEPAGFSPALEQAVAYYVPEHRALIRQSFERCLRDAQPFDVEVQLVTARGELRWVRVIGQAERQGGDRIVRVQGAIQEINARKQAELLALELGERLQKTLESITDGFFTLDRDWRFDYVNHRAEQLLGRSRESLRGREIWQEFPDARGSASQRAYEKAVAEQVSVSFDDHYVPLGLSFEASAYPSSQGLAVYFRDVTLSRRERERMRLLEASVARLNDIIVITEAAPLDPPGPRIQFVNDAFTRLTGYAPDEVLGQSPRMLQGPLTDRAELDRIRKALEQGEPVQAELVNYSKAGEPYWVEIDIVPVGLAGQASSHFVAVERDVTERKRDQDRLRRLNATLEARVLARTAELAQARDEANQANQAKSAFLATMSHEIRTPMNGVIGMLDVLQQASLRGDQVEMVELIRDSAFSLLTIIEDILDFSKIEAGKLSIEHEPLWLDEVVEKVCGLLDHMATHHGVQLTVFIDPAIPEPLIGDQVRLRQVLINLASNAIKFSGGRAHPGQVSVRALLAERQAGMVWIELIVADNGIGIDAATQARLFTPFSQADASTTRRFGGTGLGLAICDTLVRLMAGTIKVESSLGKGARFTVGLPLPVAPPSDNDAAGLREQRLPAWPESGPALRCRIVGDVATLAQDFSAYLRAAGATVDLFPDLAAAAAAAQGEGLWIWLVLPGQPVLSLAEWRAIAPGAPAAETRFVVCGNGRRRRPRVEAVDLVLIDVDLLFRRGLLELVALAAGLDLAQDLAHDESTAQGRPGPASARHEALRQGRLILVAEDNETNRKVILRQLELVGFAAEVVVDGREALQRWRSGDFALLLTDLHMPEMDGYALTAAIRAEEGPGRHLPIIALTANALRDEKLRCRAAGMDAYLTKPVRLAELRAAIEDWLGPAPGRVQSPELVPPSSKPPEPATVRSAPADLRVLAAMVGDDPAVIAQILQTFWDSATQSSLELHGGAAASDMGAAGDAAHKLKSAARSIGAERLGGICALIEEAARAGRSQALGDLLRQFDAELAMVRRFLGAPAAPADGAFP